MPIVLPALLLFLFARKARAAGSDAGASTGGWKTKASVDGPGYLDLFHGGKYVLTYSQQSGRAFAVAADATDDEFEYARSHYNIHFD